MKLSHSFWWYGWCCYSPFSVIQYVLCVFDFLKVFLNHSTLRQVDVMKQVCLCLNQPGGLTIVIYCLQFITWFCLHYLSLHIVCLYLSLRQRQS